MGKKWNKGLSLFLALTLILALIPCASFAGGDGGAGGNAGQNGEAVLQSVVHRDAVSSARPNASQEITLTVPYGYDNFLDLSQGMTLSYDTSVYSSAVASFESGSEAEVGGSGVTMTITYQRTGNESNFFTTDYTVYVKRQTYEAPSFSGTLTIRSAITEQCVLSVSDFDSKYEMNDGNSLDKIVITGSHPSFGSLMYKNPSGAWNTYEAETEITMADIQAGKLKFEATMPGSTIYYVDGYQAGASEVVGRITLKIIVIAGTTIDKITMGSISSLGYAKLPKSEICSKFKELTGAELNEIKFTLPSSSNGKLYSDYNADSASGTAVTGSAYYTAGQLENITFVPNDTYSGTVNLSYSAYAKNDPTEYKGTIAVPVSGVSYGLTDITATVYQDKTLAFSSSIASTVKSRYKSKSGTEMTAVSFQLPQSSEGVLYEKYSSASSNTKASEGKSYSASALSNFYFVPKSNYAGTLTLIYTATDGTTEYNGKIKITVRASSVAEITDTITMDETWDFPKSDINTKVKNASGISSGTALDYIVISSVPSKGKVCYDSGSSISSGSTKYYYKGSSSKKYLEKLSYIPAAKGTYTIGYMAYDVNGNSYSGKISLDVEESDTDLQLISYSADKGEKITFKVSDFTAALKKETSVALDYIKVSLPSSGRGTLYYDYTSSSKYDSQASTSTKYYSSGSSKKLISKLTFVPKSSYTGYFYLEYTAYDDDGDTYTGKIKITIRDEDSASGDIETLTYTIKNTDSQKFSASKINTELRKITSSSLDYVKFTLPESKYGKLYYKYSKSSSSNTAVSESKKYYRNPSSSELDLSEVSFVPNSDYSGKVTISYTAYDGDGDSYEGFIKITVEEGSDSELGVLTYSLKNDQMITMPSGDINTKFQKKDGDSFEYVKITPPSGACGVLYESYTSQSNFGAVVTSSGKYYRTKSPYLYNVTFVPKSAFKGTVDLKYTAYDSQGDSYSGIVRLTITDANNQEEKGGSKYFKDVTASYDSWATVQIDSLYSRGIVQGSGGYYRPSSKITRGDFMLMLYRAFGLSKYASKADKTFKDVSQSSYYYDAVCIAKGLGIAKGDEKGRFNPNANLTRQDAMTLVDRTMDVLGKNLKDGTASDLSKFTDRSAISSYAYTSVATLVKAGAITGYTQNGVTKFKPKENLSRAEMAVILYRVMAL